MVTCIATDASMNTNSCTFTVRIEDATPPIIMCPPDMTMMEGNVTNGAVVTFAATATDDCDAAPGVVCAPDSGSIFLLGTTTVTCTSTNATGLTSECLFDITVVDTTGPSITCPTDMLVECVSPTGTVVTFNTPPVSDVCDPAPVVSFLPASGTTFPLGVTPVVCTALDASGNSTMCTFNVTVQDIAPPTIMCPLGTITEECTSLSGRVVIFPTPSATDLCDPSPTVVCVPASGSLFPLGASVVTCTAKDAAGNESMCTIDIIVQDTTAPMITCPPTTTFECDQGTPPGTMVTLPAALVSDNCDPAPSVSYSPDSGFFPFGTTAVTVTAMDSTGNMSMCTFDVVVQDMTAPTIDCPGNFLVECTSPSGAIANYATPPITDACDPAPTVTVVPPSGTLLPPGVTPVTVTATDANGNASTCVFNVIVQDTTEPVITCPSIVIQECDSGPGAVVLFPSPTATDECDLGPLTISCSPASGDFFPLGQTTVMCTATDSAGNSSQCEFFVFVLDIESPDIFCPVNMTVECTQALTPVTFTPTASDNCDPSPDIVCVPDSGSGFAPGVHEVVCTVTDESLNTATCTFTITVVDNTPPTITCPVDVEFECTSSAGTIATYAAMADDLCDDNPLVTYVPPSGSLLSLGTTTVLATARDASGNSNSCTFPVTIVDSTAPTISCPGTQFVECAAPGGANVTFPMIVVDDICDPSPSFTCLPPSNSFFPLGTTQVLCTATDASGNSATCTFLVTVQDNAAPMISCPADFTAPCDNINGGIVTYNTPTATDPCEAGPITVTCSPPSGAFFNIGPNVVTCSATDGNGNTTSCSFTITVEDSEAPIITCPGNMTLTCSPGGALLTYSVTVLDNCDPAPAVDGMPASGTLLPAGLTTVNCTATDISGNQSTCSFEVNVVDNEPPMISCPTDIETPCTNSMGTPVTFTPMVSDNCDAAVMVVCTPSSGSMFQLGTTMVACEATDDAGNSNSCSFMVTIFDNSSPVILCPEPIVVNATGPDGAIVQYQDPVAVDECDPSPVVNSMPISGSLLPIGTTSVMCTAIDEAGNTATCSFLIIVLDSTAAFTSGSFEMGQSPGSVPATPWAIDAGSSHVIQPFGVASSDGGMPSDGSNWCDLSAEGSVAATPPSNPGGAGLAPENAAGISQTFVFNPARPLFGFEAAFLFDGTSTPGANDFMSVDITDGVTTFNLYYASAFSSTFPGTSALYGLPMTEVTRVISNLAVMFPTADNRTPLTVSIQVGNGGDGIDPSHGYVDGFRVSAPAAATMVNGSGVNSLLFVAPPPILGELWRPSVDARAHDGGFNTVLVYSGASPGINISKGELLIDLSSSLLFLASQPNNGVTEYALPTPSNFALLGLVGTAQAYVTGGGFNELTNAAQLTLGIGVLGPRPDIAYNWAPMSGPVPLEVSFTDLSLGPITSWSWNFGDGYGSTLQNPTHTYAIPGVYDVLLHVEGPGGFDAVYEYEAVTVTE